MKCTDCGQEVKPIVALDLDGTLGNYHDHLRYFAEAYLDRKLPGGWDGRPDNWEDYLGIDRPTYRDIKLAFRQGGMKRTMPMFGDADIITQEIKAEGAEIWITTTRPWMRLDSVDPDTREWLRRHNIAYDHLLYDEHKYEQLAKIVHPERVVFVLDDLVPQAAAARRNFGEAAHLVARQHTAGIDRLELPVTNLSHAMFIAIERVKEWKLSASLRQNSVSVH